MDEKRIQCLSNASQHVPIFNRFPVIQPVSSKVHHFSIFLHILASPGYAHGIIAVIVTWMEREFNAGQTHIYSSIYPSIFNLLRAIARYWSEIATFCTPLHLTPPWGCSHWNSGKKFGPQKTGIMGLPGSEDSLTIGWAVSTEYQRVTDGRTDRRTNVQPISRTCAVWLTHVKNWCLSNCTFLSVSIKSYSAIL